MILDATAGNRTMWQIKKPTNIIFIDMEKKLEVKPDVFCDHRQLPFTDSCFDTIFYDPPHNWGGAIHYFSFPNKEERAKVFKDVGGTPTYYGWDKYKHRQALVASIYNTLTEFRRVLKEDGLLWFKWNEMRITINQILTVFHDWNELMRLYIDDPTHTAGKQQTYWVCLSKKKQKTAQQSLTQF